MALDNFARHMEIPHFQVKGKAHIAEGNVQGKKFVLVKPMTYMNLSGEAVRETIDFYKIKIEDVLVVYDDVDTPFNQLRLRYQGSAGGHNGIKSIIQHTGTQSFKRIRIGVSRPPLHLDTAQYVLSNFAKQESKELIQVLDRCKEAMMHSLDHTFEETMGLFNK
jgi:PTH1 family peptidyl-tRNA hydrolase